MKKKKTKKKQKQKQKQGKTNWFRWEKEELRECFASPKVTDYYYVKDRYGLTQEKWYVDYAF